MGTRLKRLDFRAQYPKLSQGLFIFQNPKRIPKDQAVINVGRELSAALLDIPVSDRSFRVSVCLADIVSHASVATLTNIEILFTPSLHLDDAVEAIRAVCRNRKLCIAWPGIIQDTTLTYTTPDSPEYFQGDLSKYADTYLITD